MDFFLSFLNVTFFFLLFHHRVYVMSIASTSTISLPIGSLALDEVFEGGRGEKNRTDENNLDF